jgi:hypothetical protein
VVGLSSASTDGADTASASVSPIGGLSSATTDGADVSVASANIIIEAASSQTDGADVSSIAADPLADATSASVNGADVSLASIDVAGSSIAFSSDTTNGADAMSAQTGIVGGGAPFRRRWVIFTELKKEEAKEEIKKAVRKTKALKAKIQEPDVKGIDGILARLNREEKKLEKLLVRYEQNLSLDLSPDALAIGIARREKAMRDRAEKDRLAELAMLKKLRDDEEELMMVIASL